MSRVDYIYKTQLMIYQGDKAKAKAATRANLKHLLILDGLWIPKRVEHGGHHNVR